MFNVELPEFFKGNAVKDFFTDDLNGFIDMKTSNYFNSNSLGEFVEVAEEIETKLLEFVNQLQQKVEVFNSTKVKYEENNETLRDLNSQVAAFKIKDMTFGFGKSDEEVVSVENELEKKLTEENGGI